MLKLYLTRHGQTDMNVQKLYCGWTDAKLNENGILQCEELQNKLSRVKFDMVISSGLIRTVESASIISGIEKEKILKKSSLNEVNFGKWEGKTAHYINENYYKEFMEWAQDWKSFCFPGGEDFSQFANRVQGFYEGLVQSYSDKTILITAHEGSVKLLLMTIFGWDKEAFWKLSIESGCYSLVEINETHPVLKSVNR